MANDVQIDKLSIEVGADAQNAAAELDALSAALDRLAKTGRLTRIQNNLNGLRNQLKGFESINSSIAAIERLKTALNGLSGIQNAKGLSSTVNVLKRFPEIAAQLQGVNFDGFRENVASLSAAFEHLGTVDKAGGLASTVNALKKIPDITSQLNPETIKQFGVAAQGVRDAIQPLATEIDKLGTGFSRLPTNVQKVITANQKLVNSSNAVAKSVNKQGVSLLSALGKLTVFGFTLRTVAHYIGQGLSSYNHYVEIINLLGVSMGEYTQQAYEFTQELEGKLGIDPSEAAENMGTIQALARSFGLASDRAYILSKNLTQLGYDLASIREEQDTVEMFRKIQAAISGELEPIRRLGIDISNARLQQELYSLGIRANVNDLNQADKATLRYIAIIKQSTLYQTDMARTLNSPANMVRIFNAQLQLLSRTIGSLFIPALKAILPPMIAVIKVIREVIASIAAFFGVTIEFPEESENAITGLGGISDGIDDVGSSAAKAAEEVRYLIGGFDELNVLPDPNKGTGGGGAGGGVGSLLDGIELPEYDIFKNLAESEAWQWVEKIKSALKALLPLIAGVGAAFLAWKFGPDIINGLFKIKDLISGIKGNASLAMTPFAIWAIAIGTIVGQFVNLLLNSEKFRQGLVNIGETAHSALDGLFDGFSEGIQPAIDAIKGLGQDILDLLPDDFKQDVLTFFQETLPKLIDDLDLNLGDLVTTLVGIGLLLVPGGQVAGIAVLGFEAITLAVREFGGLTDEQMETVKQVTHDVFEFIGKFVGGTISALVTFVTEHFGGIIEFLDGVFSGDWQKIFEGLKRTAEAPIKAISTFFDTVFGIDIKQTVQDVIDYIGGLFTGWFEDVQKKISEVLSSIGNAVKGLFGLETKTNSITSRINTANISVLPNFPSFEVPALAGGGVLYNSRLVLAGEYANARSNPEIIAPQSMMRETVSEANEDGNRQMINLLGQILVAIQESGGDFEVDGETLFKIVKNESQRERRRTGKNPLW